MMAMVLAAGRGERMRPLTDREPKPLLPVADRALVVHLIEALVEAGFRDLVVNHAWLGDRIVSALGDGGAFGARIRYSPEPPGALDTGGGISRALPLLGPRPFLVVNGDLWTDYPYSRLRARELGADLAHLVLADNPPHHPEGDFRLEAHGRVRATGEPRLTFAGIGVYRPELFVAPPGDRFPLAPLLRKAMAEDRVSGEHHRGAWTDVGTPDRLAILDRELRTRRRDQRG
jgi:N-acetyl-alpha-D-muramate 1-phosphate uridylyltransferase